MNYQEKGELLKALGHPVRLKMVEGLMKNECNVNKIVKVLNLPQSTVSQHLGILRKSGVLQAHKQGVKTSYCVIDKKIKEILRILKK